jgi:hypothetical protein
MDDQKVKSVSPNHIFIAAVIVLAVIVVVFITIFVIDWNPDLLRVDQLDKDINSEMFESQIDLAIDSRNLKACEEEFSDELITLACLLEAAPRAWLTYNDPSLCDGVSQTALSQPVNFAGDFLFDNHGACITFLSIGAGKDFCHQAVFPLSQASCQHIVRGI